MINMVLIKKYNSSSFFWDNLIERKKINGSSVEKIIENYCGFEGEVGFFCSVDELYVEDDLKQHLFKSKNNNSLFLCVISEDGNLPEELKNKVVRVGYDFGICEEEMTLYSSIFNEILFGINDELTFYKNNLNKYYLFSEKNVAENYANTHHRLFLNGKDVEDDEEMKIYEIWKWK